MAMSEYAQKYETYRENITRWIKSSGTLAFLAILNRGQQQENDTDVNEHIAFLQLRASEIIKQENANLSYLALRCALLEEQFANATEALLQIAKIK